MQAVPSVVSSVIAFPQSRTRASGGNGTGAPAEVIIFPGVRVERLMYDLADRPHAARAGAAQTLRQAEFDIY